MDSSPWKRIEALRGFAIVLVVVYHGSMAVLGARCLPPLTDVPWAFGELTIHVLSRSLSMVAITAFLVASGLFMGRFVTNWSGARTLSRQIGLRWLGWSLLGYTLRLSLERSYTLHTALEALPWSYGPFSAYWFLAAMVLFTISCPWLAQWAKRSPWSTLTVAIAMEFCSWLLPFVGLEPPMRILPLQAGPFLMGLLFSKHTTVVMSFLERNRRLIGWLMLVVTTAAVASTALEFAALGGPCRLSGPLNVFLRIYALVGTAWYFTWTTRKSWWVGFVEDLGNRSLAILLLSDPFQQLVYVGLWHLPALVHPAVDKSPPPLFLTHPAIGLVHIAVGLGGPILFAAVAERLVGRRWRRLLVG